MYIYQNLLQSSTEASTEIVCWKILKTNISGQLNYIIKFRQTLKSILIVMQFTTAQHANPSKIRL